MIKKIVLFIALMFIAINSYSMDIDLGGKMGVGVGWWGGAYADDVDVVGATNAVFGPYASLGLHKNVALQFELLLAVVSNSDEFKKGNVKIERSFRNVAFELPILLKPKFKLGPGEMFFLFGPRMLILLDDFNVKTKASVSNVSHELDTGYDIGRQFHLGLTLGLGYEIKLGPGKLQASLNITPYLTNYGRSYSKAMQNEAYLDVGYAYIFED